MNEKKKKREGSWKRKFSPHIDRIDMHLLQEKGMSCYQPRGQMGDNDIIFYLVSPSLKSVRKDNSQTKHTERRTGKKAMLEASKPEVQCDLSPRCYRHRRWAPHSPSPESSVHWRIQTLDLPENSKGRV